MDFLRKRLTIIIAFLLIGGGFLVWWLPSQRVEKDVYQTAPVERGHLTTSVGATGIVRAGQSAVLTWQTDGRVDAVYVAVGDAIRQDDVLASLSISSLSQSILLAQADLVMAQQELERLRSSNLSLAQAQQNLSNARQSVEDAQSAYDRLTRVRVSEALIEDTQEEIEQLQNQLKFQEWIFDKFYAHLYDGNSRKAEQIIGLNNTRNRLEALVARLNWYTGQPTELEIQQAQARLKVATARMEDAQREVDRLGDGQNTDDIVAAQARVDAAMSTLNLSKIIAPFDGVITEAQVLPGDLVSRGALAFRLEDLERLYIDLQVSEVDINSLAIGQPVSVSFDGVFDKTYSGKVVKINLAGETVGGAVVFPVSVELTDADQLVKPGMTAAVTVVVKEVQDALLVLNRAVRGTAAERVVYVLKDDRPVAVKIRLGTVADTYSEVVGGDLQVGDLVILNPPSIALENSSP